MTPFIKTGNKTGLWNPSKMKDLALKKLKSKSFQRTSQNLKYRRILIKYLRKYKNRTKHDIIVSNQKRLNQIESMPPQNTDDSKASEFYNGYNF
ncbi:14779_t:CDS:2 [Rhizophagus irregularis]|nr:14779_t:CDS:2 [Rhizophagus irregularis]